jgi:hypothetical protein
VMDPRNTRKKLPSDIHTLIEYVQRVSAYFWL